jgi:hypothetical protein
LVPFVNLLRNQLKLLLVNGLTHRFRVWLRRPTGSATATASLVR